VHLIARDYFVVWRASKDKTAWSFSHLSVELEVIAVKEIEGYRKAWSQQLVLNPVVNVVKHQVIAKSLHRFLSVVHRGQTRNITPHH